jgi:hypothetical protein
MSQWFLNKNPALERTPMFSIVSLITFSILLFVLISAPAHSATSINSWQDANDVTTFSDNPTNTPSDAQVELLSENASLQTASETDPTEMAAEPTLNQPLRVVTQGEFAIQLTEELGLGEDPTAEEAADVLTAIRISPRLGEWELDQPMTQELTVRFRKLTIASAETGRITLSPEQVLLAFDTVSALLGLTVPVTTGPEETSDSPYSIAETPPLVYVAAPPPDVYPYYLWAPVVGGFWWNGFLSPGFFMLDVNLFFSNHHNFVPRDHRFRLDSGRVGRQFRSHIIDHHIKRSPVVSNPDRVHRSPSGVRAAAYSSRVLSPRTRSHSGSRSSASYTSGLQPVPAVRSPLQSPSVRHDSSSAFSASGRSSPLASQGFNTGLPQGRSERAASR